MTALRATNWAPTLTVEAAPEGALLGAVPVPVVPVLGLPVVAVVPVEAAPTATRVAELTAEVASNETVEVPSSTLM